MRLEHSAYVCSNAILRLEYKTSTCSNTILNYACSNTHIELYDHFIYIYLNSVYKSLLDVILNCVVILSKRLKN